MTTPKKRSGGAVVKWSDEEKTVAKQICEQHILNGRIAESAIDADPRRKVLARRKTKDIKQWFMWNTRYKFNHQHKRPNMEDKRWRKDDPKWTPELKGLLMTLTRKHHNGRGVVWNELFADPEVNKLGTLVADRKKLKNYYAYLQRTNWAPSDHVTALNGTNGAVRRVSASSREFEMARLGYQAFHQTFLLAGKQLLPWESIPLDEQVAWKAAVNAVQPEPIPEMQTAKFCPGCGMALQAITLAMNI